MPGSPEIRLGPWAPSQVDLGSFPPLPFPLDLPLGWVFCPAKGFGTLEGLLGALGVWSLCGFLHFEEDLLRQPGGLTTAWAKWRGVSPLPFTAVLKSVRYGGSGSTQTSLHEESVCHVRIGPCKGCGLGNDLLQALPEQTVGADRKAVCQFC